MNIQSVVNNAAEALQSGDFKLLVQSASDTAVLVETVDNQFYLLKVELVTGNPWDAIDCTVTDNILN